METKKVWIEDYSEKAFVVLGDTKPIKDLLRAAGGKFNRNLHGRTGWVFSKKHLDKVQSLLS